MEDELDSVLKAIVNRRRELRGMIPLKDSDIKSLVSRSNQNVDSEENKENEGQNENDNKPMTEKVY